MKSHSQKAGTSGCFLVLTLVALTPFVQAQNPPPQPTPAVEPAEPFIAPEPAIPLVPPPAPSTVKPPPAPDGDSNPWQKPPRSPDDLARVFRDVELLQGLSSTFGESQARRLLIIPGANTTEDDLATRLEDLTVMATILDRAARPDQERRPDRWLGDLRLGAWRTDNGREHDAILIEGYGAIFLLAVDFPLVDTPTPEEKSAEFQSSRDTTWEKTRREILGQPDEDQAMLQPSSAYDAARVNELERRLKEALRHAGNLRGLSPNDWIIVQVTGRTPAQQAKILKEPVGFSRHNITGYVKLADSVMTLRVRKSAADIFAEDGMKLDDFVREVKVSRRLEKPAPPRQ